MPKSPALLDREIAEALAKQKRMSKFLEGRKPEDARKTPAPRTSPRTASRPSKTSSRIAASVRPASTSWKLSAPKTTKKSTSPTSQKPRAKQRTGLGARRRSHSVKGASRDDIDTLIASDDPNDWSVARDYALEQNVQDLLVQLDMARALSVAPSDLDVTEGQPYDESFEVELGRNQTYVVVPDEDVAREIALARVTEDLENEPQNFSPSFIEAHIDEKKLKRYVYDSRMEDDYVDELASRQPRDFWRLATQLRVDVEPETDEDGDELDPTDDQVEAVKEAYAKDAADSPMEFFRDIYGDEAVKYAIEAAGIDVSSAAEEAVNTDGWEHFLAHYDGRSHTTDTGLVYWRTN